MAVTPMHENMLASIGSPRAPILVQLSEFEGRRSLDIRRYFTSASDGELHATKKGIGLNKEALRVLINVLAAESQRIEQWLDAPAGADTDAAATLAIRKDALEERRTAPRPSISSLGHWQSPAFFHVAYDGHDDILTLNRRHPVGVTLTAARSSSNLDVAVLVELILAILTSYSRSKELFNGVATISADALFDDLEFNWGLILERQLTKESPA